MATGKAPGLDGHIAGHYLSALAMMYANTNDKRILDRLNYTIAELKICQDKNGDGYLGGVPGSHQLWIDVRKGNFDTFNKRWVPFYNIHKDICRPARCLSVQRQSNREGNADQSLPIGLPVSLRF
jgi:DUF1680 family protein